MDCILSRIRFPSSWSFGILRGGARLELACRTIEKILFSRCGPIRYDNPLIVPGFVSTREGEAPAEPFRPTRQEAQQELRPSENIDAESL